MQPPVKMYGHNRFALKMYGRGTETPFSIFTPKKSNFFFEK
jgi:hypothetical protein